jgi:hypothetical protein
MQYKTGDRVVIVKHRTPTMNASGGMDKYLGKPVTIDHVIGNRGVERYTIAEDCGRWIWCDSMFNHQATAAMGGDTYKRF